MSDCSFTNNEAISINVENKKVLFTGKILFRNNTVAKTGRNFTNSGAAINSSNSEITFEGDSTIKFENNSDGGAMYLSASTLAFKGFAIVHFRNNSSSRFGGALHVDKKSTVTFEGSSISTFTNNSTRVGGAIYFTNGSHIIFKNNSNTSFTFNKAQYGAGSWCFKGQMMFTGNSRVMFSNGEAVAPRNIGGGVGFANCIVKFTENTTVLFKNNTQSKFGVGVFCNSTSDITFGKNSKVIFGNNNAINNGGGLSCVQSNITLKENTTISFTNNAARLTGGAISNKQCMLVVKENSSMTFHSNRAKEKGGGAINAFHYSFTIFDQNSTVSFTNNTARTGGAMHLSFHNFTLAGTCNVNFNINKADMGGGALYLFHSNVTVKKHTTISFTKNSAMKGGAVHAIRYSAIVYDKFTTVEYTYNTVQTVGGAMHISDSRLVVASKSMMFSNNMAVQNGGALHLNNNFYMEYKNGSKVTFHRNKANDYGGAVFYSIDKDSFLNFNTTDIVSTNNIARFGGNSMYVRVPKWWNISKLHYKIKGINDASNFLTTSSYKLELHPPAIPIDDINGASSYYIPNIMLGQEIMIDACVLDYYNQAGNVVPFLISTDNCTNINGCQDYYLDGQDIFSVFCHTKFQGVSLVGQKIMPTTAINYSIALISYFAHDFKRKKIEVKVNIQLVPCHPGFWHNNEKCECFSGGDVIPCSGSNSVIKAGNWFGMVDGKPTVTICPYSDCNFTCCQTTTGFNSLSPQRSNQCRSHRSGMACGSCADGYTLSFGSIECIDVNKCTIGQAVLVTALTVTYWIAVVVVVFIMMYYKVGIQYLYGITYYYSMIDILLLPSTSASQTLYTIFSITSSFAKVIPQFLGQFCLTDGLIGIDQQFIHYIHPLAVSFLLVIICVVARCSATFSAFISKGIIQALCFLLLLYPTL